MTIKIYVNTMNVWLQGEDDATALTSWANDELALADNFTVPKPQYYPKAQLRRLSPFSKVALSSLDLPQVLESNLPLVFASRHGDLAKTVNLIKDAATGEDLSPTQFALSVHNATTGLFSIATGNTAETTTISAGKNTFIEGLVEAAMQAKQESTAVVYNYCDFDMTEEYQQFNARILARCISMVITTSPSESDKVSINITLNNENNSDKNSSNVNQIKESNDLAVDFIRSYYKKNTQQLSSNRYALFLGFN